MTTLFFAVLVGAAMASTTELEAHLTGKSERRWNVSGRPWTPKMGTGCASGEFWSFDAQHAWTKTTCEDGNTVTVKGTWSWVESDDNPVQIQLDDETYLLDIRQKKASIPGDPPKLVMILRTRKEAASEPFLVTELWYQEF